jgi:hypothetical protein
VNKERLLKLAEHLDKGKLGHKRFDFKTFNNDVAPSHAKKKAGKYIGAHGCGTNGCAIGECPFAFPEHWSIQEDGHTKLEGCYYGGFQGAMKFFDLDWDDTTFLFMPAYNADELAEGKLSTRAGRHQVAAHIRKFVANGGIYVTK